MQTNISKHSYSVWPLAISAAIALFLFGLVSWLHHNQISYLILSMLAMTFCIYKWWGEKLDTQEAKLVQANCIKFGLRLFIFSEIVLFGVGFVGYFYAQILPLYLIEDMSYKIIGGLAQKWTFNIYAKVDAWNLPFINTLILALSSCTLTWAKLLFDNMQNTQDTSQDTSIVIRDKAICNINTQIKNQNCQAQIVHMMLITIVLGTIFLVLQCIEYYHLPFKLSDNFYTSQFYLITGMHGLHVLAGVVMLTIIWTRLYSSNAKSDTLFFNLTCMYWHFVDVVWLCLFVFIYLLG